MATQGYRPAARLALTLAVFVGIIGVQAPHLLAQAPSAATTKSQLGTVKTVAGNVITMSTDKGETVTVTVAAGAKVIELPVGSTDLKAATPSDLKNIAVGDRALVTGKAGESPDSITALRVILIKSSAIAQMQAAQEADWREHGIGGIVTSINPATGTIVVESGKTKISVETSSKTVFKRFAGDSAKYSDAKISTISAIRPKDHLQARGTKSADGSTMQAEEVLSGSFEDLSGLLLSVDAQTGDISLKDLATKKVVTVHVTANSSIRSMPEQLASRFAAQSNGGGQGSGRHRGGREAAGGDEAGMRRSAGADLSQMISRLPAVTLADLHKGDAVMIVASQASADSNVPIAVTVLTGVDAILTANPNGGMDLSMSLGGVSDSGGGAE